MKSLEPTAEIAEKALPRWVFAVGAFVGIAGVVLLFVAATSGVTPPLLKGEAYKRHPMYGRAELSTATPDDEPQQFGKASPAPAVAPPPPTTVAPRAGGSSPVVSDDGVVSYGHASPAVERGAARRPAGV
jgi:hypothetical protein